MILFIEPISKNIGMYVPAYPLPIMEVGSFVKANLPETEIGIISIPVDYGLPLTKEGKEQIYHELIGELAEIKPDAVGVSCTAIAQADEVINLCETIKAYNPHIFIFVGGYFPTLYYEELFARTSAIDLIVIGEGEIPVLRIVEFFKKGKNPRDESIPNLVWKENGKIHLTKKGERFNLEYKAPLNLALLRHTREYDILPYAFSRGCPYRCGFCMEEFIRPVRKQVPYEIVQKDLVNLTGHNKSHILMVSDALFDSFHLFQMLRSLGMRVNFETRCDVLDPSIIPQIADVCGMLALGFESASYSTLRRMNKVRDRAHYEQYLNNTIAIFQEAIKHEICTMVFMIAGYPEDTEKDLEESLIFARELAEYSGPGGHIFKIGECRAYPKTKLYELAASLPDVVFDNDGVFGQNVVRQPSKDLKFDTVLAYMKEIFSLSNVTPKLQNNLLAMMPFFRLPGNALQDDMIPDQCFRDRDKGIFNVQVESLSTFRELVPKLIVKYKNSMSDQRSTRDLVI